MTTSQATTGSSATGSSTTGSSARVTDNAATVAGIYAAFGRGDVPAILGTLADDVRWEDWADNSAQRAGVAHMVPRRGAAEVAGFFQLVGAWTMERFEVLDLIGNGRQVVGEISLAARLPDGTRFEDEELHLWTFDDAGRVTRFRHYVDTGKHIAVTGGTAPPRE